MAKQVWVNNFEVDLTGTVKATPDTGTPATEVGYGILQLSGAAGTLLPVLTGGDWFLLTLFKVSGGLEADIEIVKVTAVDTSSGSETRISVSRAQEGTIARAYSAGDKVGGRMTAGTASNFLQKTSNLGDVPDPAAARGNLGAEPAIVGDAATKYWRGNKTWSDFASDVRAVALTGLSVATSAAVAATDTVLAAVGKLQRQINDHFGSGGSAHATVVSGGLAGFMSGAAMAKLDGIASGATANSPDATLLARANHTGTQAISTISGLQGALDGKQPNLVSGTNIKTVNGGSLVGSGDLVVTAGEVATVAVTYNTDGSVNTVTEDGLVKTFAYNSDGTVNTISWPVSGGKTRTQTYAYSSGALTGVTTSEV